MLDDITNRYPFLDRDGNPLKLDRQKAMDQFGNEHGPEYSDLTSIVIISAERGEDTARCVDSIYANTPEPFEIILSDAASSKETIDTIAALEDQYKNLHVIYNKESTGTTGQRNQGAYYAKGSYLLFMDNDVLVLSEWLKHLQRTAAQHEATAMVGAKLLQTDAETVYYCGCHAITLEKEGKVYGIGLNKEGPMANLKKADMLAMQSGEVPWYTTTALLVNRQAFFAIGGFDDMSEAEIKLRYQAVGQHPEDVDEDGNRTKIYWSTVEQANKNNAALRDAYSLLRLNEALKRNRQEAYELSADPASSGRRGTLDTQFRAMTQRRRDLLRGPGMANTGVMNDGERVDMGERDLSEFEGTKIGFNVKKRFHDSVDADTEVVKGVIAAIQSQGYKDPQHTRSYSPGVPKSNPSVRQR